MQTSSGRYPARVTHFLTRHPSSPTRFGSSLIVLAAIIAVGIGAPAAAQDDDPPENAVIAPLAARALTLDAVAVDGALIAVGERGHILVSTDRGETWQQSQVPTRAGLNGVFFHDRNLGWAVGHDSVILRTTDGGTTWERVNWAPEEEAPFFDVWFADAENGIALGAYGSYYTTQDGGTTWTYEPIGEDDWHLHKVAQSLDGRLYIAAEAGFAYRSDDGGATWTDLPSPYEGSFFGVLPLEGDVVLLFGLRGHLFRSEDAGETWSEIDTGTVAMLTNGLELADGTILISGLGGTVLISEDLGRSFTLHQQANRRGISAVVDAGDGLLFMVGEFGVKTLTIGDLTAVAD
jgi:photosystem II stability/assembly factor-like uncharacterized protein